MIPFFWYNKSMEKLLIVSHCILNTLSKVKMDERRLENEYVLKKEVMNKVLKNNIQLLQLPCPEFLLYGKKRWGHVKEQFDNVFFKEQAKLLLKPVIEQIQEYHNNGIEIIGVVGLDGSPSCGINYTCSADWQGSIKDLDKISKANKINESGVFVEVFKELLADKQIDYVDFYSLEDINKKITG